jgi:hypothetical protein
VTYLACANNKSIVVELGLSIGRFKALLQTNEDMIPKALAIPKITV